MCDQETTVPGGNRDRTLTAPPPPTVAEQAGLAAWNDTAAALPLAPLHQLIAAQAARDPGAPALVFDGGQLSYAELEARANQLAHLLREAGVGPERIVGVCMGRGKELIVALLAVLKAGGAYLPLDPAYPPARLADMVADARPVAMLSDGSLPAGLLEGLGAGAAPPVIDLGRDAARIAAHPHAPPQDLATLSTLAYVIYTSGSTGRPKGVLLEHRSFATFVLGGGQIYGVTPADRGLHFSSVSFDASIEEIFIPLAHGAALVVTAGHSPPDFADLQELIERHGITTISLPTAYWQAWVSELSDGRGALPASLRQVIIGGEAASGERYNRWRALAPPSVRLINSYGPTEATVASTWYAPSPLRDEPPGPLAIGRPYPNERAYLLDGDRRPVPIGVQGELYIAGDGLARGYHNRPDLTAERFVSVAGLEGDEPVRLYRTGDLARWRHDGVLLYDGRADQQVKVRGFRIEPTEIEEALRGHPAVRATAVVARPDPAGELSLVGYVVLKAPAEPAELRAFLEERLPQAMVPAALVALDALPLTPSGKVDRRALPAPELPAPRPAARGEQARTPVERALTAIWEELLRRRGIGVHDNFFDLGGHSLLAMRMLSRVATELGARLPVSIMIHNATIAQLGQVIAAADERPAWSVLVPIQPRGERPPLFCVHGITGDVLWFNDLGRCLAPDQPMYGLQARGLAPNERHATTVEQMAAWYVEAMRGVQPRGPYFIAGASFGSIIALEMARQLEAAGERAGMVAAFDYDPYPAAEAKRSRLEAVASYLRHLPAWVRNDLLRMAPAERRAWATWRLRYRLKRLVGCLLRVPLPVDAADLLPYGAELPLHRRELLIANDVAFERYRPQPFGGPLTLFATEGWYTGQAAATGKSGWARLARGGVTIVVVPGSHETMFKQPFVAELATQLRQAITLAMAADGAPSGEAPPGRAEGQDERTV